MVKRKSETKYVPEYKCKKCKKANAMWVDQIYFRLDALEKSIKALEETVKYISDFIHDKSEEK